jgi:hypothetical protein
MSAYGFIIKYLSRVFAYNRSEYQSRMIDGEFCYKMSKRYFITEIIELRIGKLIATKEI